MANGSFARIDDQVLGFTGCWTMATVRELWEQLSTESFNCADLEKIEQIDSAGLAAIITALLSGHDSEEINLRHCPESIKPLVTLYGFEPYLIHSSETGLTAE
ncbi:STAS domain-containing protein [Celerinatantimonas diazotrophica]|uniref:ABC-type transporter Mla MlaB component n=1 Tax=Celerinatantimonas diazotrophica TaxID=412034 RepID=A0A4R1KGR6_9GAMM|nr:hypothetical protein [Celerinatantimonas diazotrophica]TCK63233.1 ABC-type transporter Mla MlaB component [Celerinatantimonas diazotrophica]CAG9295602.1 hypothetical protein CEDIAZO_00722 [Celerinatantimonas diazotrophica]